MLSHGGVSHLAFNVAMLLMFGGFAEQHLRRHEYLAFFFIVGTAASFANLIFWPNNAPSLGASGAIFGLIGYSLYHYVQNHEENLYPYNSSSSGLLESEHTLFLSAMIGLGSLLSYCRCYYNWVPSSQQEGLQLGLMPLDFSPVCCTSTGSRSCVSQYANEWLSGQLGSCLYPTSPLLSAAVTYI